MEESKFDGLAAILNGFRNHNPNDISVEDNLNNIFVTFEMFG